MDASGKPIPTDVPTVLPRAAGDPRVLSIGQQRLWYLAQFAPDSGVYNVPYASRLEGQLDVAAFEKALNAVVERHEILRTVILAPGGRPVPVLLKKWALKLNRVDLRDLPDDQREDEAQRILFQESSHAFNFARDLMLRCTLIQLADEEYLFHHVAPHVAFEGGSVQILYRDVALFYSAFLQGKPSEMSEMRLQYSDFAVWQQNLLQGEKLETLSSYWRDQLTGAPLIKLPIDLPRPAIHTMRGTRRSFVLPLGLLAASDRLFRESGTTSFRGLNAAFNVFLFALTGQTDISIGSPFMPRCTGIEDLIGFFVNTVVLRADLSGNPTYRELMRRTDAVVREAIKYADLTFDKLVDAVRPARDSSRGPLFQVNYRAPKQAYPTLQLSGISASVAEYLDNGTSKFDLALELDTANGKACFIEYCADLWKQETIDLMVSDFQALLRELILQPDTPLDSIPYVMEIGDRVRRRTALPFR